MGQWRQAKAVPQKHPRVSTRVPVRVSTVDPERDPDTGELFYRSAQETTANLSRGGAFVRSWEPLAAGRRVVVEIELPDAPNLQLVAQVAWTRRQLRPGATGVQQEPGYGVEFTGGSRDELARLDRFLEGSRQAPSSWSRSDAPAPTLP